MTTSPPPSNAASRSWRQVAAWLVATAICTLAADRLLGRGIATLAGDIRSGDRIGAENTTLSSSPVVLILGSSHAKHHYDDSTMTSALGCRVRNGGADGMGVLYARSLFQLLPPSAPVRVVLFEMSWFEAEPTTIHKLDYFYGRSRFLDSLLVGDDWRQHAKLASILYRYNGLAGPLIRSFVRQDSAPWGFSPLDGSLDRMPRQQPMPLAPASSWLAPQLEAFASDVEARGAQLFFLRSPTLVQTLPNSVTAIFSAVAARRGIPWLGPSPHDSTLRDPKMFRDATHLNRNGAAHLTRDLSAQLAALPDIRCQDADR